MAEESENPRITAKELFGLALAALAFAVWGNAPTDPSHLYSVLMIVSGLAGSLAILKGLHSATNDTTGP